jgi:hypothetical protein
VSTPERRGLRVLTQAHEDERLIGLATSAPGRVLVVLLATALLWPFDHRDALIPAIALATFLPRWRRPVLLAAALWTAGDVLVGGPGAASQVELLRSGWERATRAWERALPVAAGAIAVSVGVWIAARRLERFPSFLRRRPLWMLFVLLGLLLACVLAVDGGSSLALAWTLGPFLLWRLAYVVLSERRKRPATFGEHCLMLFPVFGGTDVPYGKGWDHLRRREARDGEALARTQLAGLKLLVLAWLWTAARKGLDGWVLDARGLDLPRPWDLMTGETASLPVAWLSIYIELVRSTLVIAIFGHVIVGGLRLLGFNVFRNTYKPLLAETVVDFWGRYYHYFKELVVEVFFFPTYARFLKGRPHLRTGAAVFAAAFFGNTLYHVLSERTLLAAGDLDGLWARFGPRLVYCFLLAVGVWISMVRQARARGRRDELGPGRRLFRIAGVWTFYALIHLWSVYVPGEGFATRLAFCALLVGLPAT